PTALQPLPSSSTADLRFQVRPARLDTVGLLQRVGASHDGLRGDRGGEPGVRPPRDRTRLDPRHGRGPGPGNGGPHTSVRASSKGPTKATRFYRVRWRRLAGRRPGDGGPTRRSAVALTYSQTGAPGAKCSSRTDSPVTVTRRRVEPARTRRVDADGVTPRTTFWTLAGITFRALDGNLARATRIDSGSTMTVTGSPSSAVKATRSRTSRPRTIWGVEVAW